MKKLSEKQKSIKAIAEHYPQPISNFKEFSKMLKKDFHLTTTRKEVAKLLGYI